MRTKDGIFFSPNYRFRDLNWNDPDNLIDAFEDRINGFYFKPAETLDGEFHAFVKGLICLSIVDLLSKIETNSNQVGNRYEYWLIKHITNFNRQNPDKPNQSIGYRFYKEFRNSLVHECLIQNTGQFSYQYNKLVHFIKDGDMHIMVINPDFLLIYLKKIFIKYISSISNSSEEYTNLRGS